MRGFQEVTDKLRAHSEFRVLPSSGGHMDPKPRRTRSGWIIAFILLAAIGVAVGGYIFLSPKLDPQDPARHRKDIASLSQEAASAISLLSQERCHRTAFAALIDQYRKRGLARAIVDEIKGFEAACGGYPELRYAEFQALITLSRFNDAEAVANRLIQEQPHVPNAWGARANVREHLEKFGGAADDYRNALALFPDPSRISASSWYMLTSALQKAGNPCEAMVPLRAYVSFDPRERRTQQISTLLNQLQSEGKCDVSGPKKKIELRFPPNASALVVDAEINGIPGRFIVDTGATTLMISSEYAKRASVRLANPAREILTATANGTTKAFVATADRVSLQGLEARNVFATILSNESGLGKEIDGLLGLSFLGHFDFRLKDRLLTLEN